MSPIRIETGPMFSSKSTSLIGHIERYLIAEKEQGVDILVFNHASDERYGKNQIVSHSGLKVEALAVKDSETIFNTIFEFDQAGNVILKPCYVDRLTAIFIDEAQFFDHHLSELVSFIDSLGIDVFAAGLDTDFKGETFGPMGDLMARADEVSKHTAVCKKKVNGHICGEPATQTQRLVNGSPANYSDPIIMVGANEAYTARCRTHHEVPGRPSFVEKKKATSGF
jgi:thymidine kinase